MSSHERELRNKAYRGELRWVGDAWVECEPYDSVKRQDRVDRMKHEVELPADVRELPDARDVLPDVSRAEIDGRKFSDYSLNPDHPQNHGKAEGWRALGYDVDDPDARREAARGPR
jgi:hypothetical protein